MNYYHLRYNVYEDAAAVEKERWLQFNNHLDDCQVKLFLEEEHRHPVSIIMSKEICLEEYELSCNDLY